MEKVIAKNGWFVLKTFNGPETAKLKTYLKSRFDMVVGHKPIASRQESTELFLVCKKFKGRGDMKEEVGVGYTFSKHEGYNRIHHDVYNPRTPQSLDGLRMQNETLNKK